MSDAKKEAWELHKSVCDSIGESRCCWDAALKEAEKELLNVVGSGDVDELMLLTVFKRLREGEE